MADPAPEEYPGAPRWVKVLGIVLLVLVLAILVIKATGIGGEHGPGRHRSSGDSARHGRPAGVHQP